VAVPPPEIRPLRLLISFSPEDRELKDRLVCHLSVLVRFAGIDIWTSDRVRAGENWQQEIETALERADVALLLMTADFLASDFIQDVEVPKLFRRREQDGLRLIPVLLRSCLWQAHPWLGSLQPLPVSKQTIASLNGDDQDRAFVELAAEVQRHTGAGPAGIVPSPKYRLLDGEALHNAHPDTFQIPTEEARRDLRPGNWAKLGFEILNSINDYKDERMWVTVDESNSSVYRGTLRSDPVHNVGAVLGDRITFAPQHVLNVATDERDVALQALLTRCAIVSRRIYVDSAWPGWLRRGEPVDGRDSGWVLMAGDEDEAYTDDANNLSLMPLRDLLDGAPPELVEVILTADEGTQWEWNPERETYERMPTEQEEQSEQP
jgi:hypothetical protein